MTPKTPWANHGDGDIMDADGCDVCTVHLRFDTSDDETADRICAAVNACAGVSDEYLSHGIVPAHQYSSIVQQRDELLRELRYIANADTIEWDDPTDFEAWAKNRARAAIEKVEGKS